MADDSGFFCSLVYCCPAVLLQSRDKLEAFQAARFLIQDRPYKTGVLCFGVKKEIAQAVDNRRIPDIVYPLKDMGMVAYNQICPGRRNPWRPSPCPSGEIGRAHV